MKVQTSGRLVVKGDRDDLTVCAGVILSPRFEAWSIAAARFALTTRS
jgi:hypothetical protein